MSVNEQSQSMKSSNTSKPSYSKMLLESIMGLDLKKATVDQIETIIKNKYDNFSTGFNNYLRKAINREIEKKNITKHRRGSKIFYKVTETYMNKCMTDDKAKRMLAPPKQGIPPIDTPHGGALSRYKCCAIPSHKISPETTDEAVDWLEKMIQLRTNGHIEEITIEKLKYFLLNAPEQQGEVENIGGKTLRFPFYRFGVPEWLYFKGCEHYRRLRSHPVSGIFHEVLNERFPGSEDTSLQYKNDKKSWSEYSSWNERNKALCEPRKKMLIANTVTATGKKKKCIVNTSNKKIITNCQSAKLKKKRKRRARKRKSNVENN
eukprot:417287_1